MYKLTHNKRNKLLEYCKDADEISHQKIRILESFCDGRIKIPSEKQSQVLYELYDKAIQEGFKI